MSMMEALKYDNDGSFMDFLMEAMEEAGGTKKEGAGAGVEAGSGKAVPAPSAKDDPAAAGAASTNEAGHDGEL
jgi:hypothetical protein